MAEDLGNEVQGEKDPVADFLAREQDQFAGLDESFGGGVLPLKITLFVTFF